MSLAEWHYNTAIHSAIEQSLYEALYGKPPPPVISYLPGSATVQAVDVVLQSREKKLQSLRKALVAAQDKMRAQANKHRTPMSFEVG